MNYDSVITSEDGTIRYRLNNQLHRLDGPAVIYKNGNEAWYQNGLLHREGGPARTIGDSYKEYAVNGNYHRLDGPAIINLNSNTVLWFYEGQRINCNSQEEFEKLIKLKIFW